MSELSGSGHERVESMHTAIERATEIVTGEIGANPLETFPNPADKERRADVVWGSHLTSEQQEAFRGVMAELGPGREKNVGPVELGLNDQGYIAVLEGGQPHKMIAELEVVSNTDRQPSAIILAASPDRKLGEAEQAIGVKLLDIDPQASPTTEKEMAEQIIKTQDNFETVDAVIPEVDIPEYSLELIGRLGGMPVKIMGIKRIYTDRTNYIQLTNEHKIATIGREGDNVALVTSATYQPSNDVAAARARRNSTSGTEYLVMSYGTHKLAEVKGEEPAKPTIAQLGAEAYKAAIGLQNL